MAVDVGGFSKMVVDDLLEQIKSRDAEIEDLKERLEAVGKQALDSVRKVNKLADAEIAEITADMGTQEEFFKAIIRDKDVHIARLKMEKQELWKKAHNG